LRSAFQSEVALCNKVSHLVNFQNNLIIDWYGLMKWFNKIKTEEEVVSFNKQTDDKASIEKFNTTCQFPQQKIGKTPANKDTVIEINNGNALACRSL
jgi:hypothetical protein